MTDAVVFLPISGEKNRNFALKSIDKSSQECYNTKDGKELI